FLRPAIPDLAPLEIERVGLQVIGGRAYEAGDFGAEQPHAERAHDGPRDLLLDPEHILDVAVVRFRPELIAGDAIGELHGDAEPAPGRPDAALERSPDVELRSDGADVLRLALERKGGRAGDHPESLDPGKGADQLVRHSVAEV